MPRSKTNAELADLLVSPQVDRTVLDAAAERIRSFDLQHLLTVEHIVQAVSSSPNIPQGVAKTVEILAYSIPLSKRTQNRLCRLAAKVLEGGEYDDHDVRSLAVAVASQCKDSDV